MEFLRPCERYESTITVTILKIGGVSSTLQLQLSQNGQLKVIALATSTNFDKSLGPSADTAWTLLPPPKPIPDFDRVAANKPEDNWLPAQLSGEVVPIVSRIKILNPRGGFPIDGICDAWNGWMGGERMDATYVALMTDMIPSMSDTLLRNDGVFDAHLSFEKIERWAEQNPGIPFEGSNSIAQAMKASIWNSTVSLDIEFKRRLPKEGLRWIFTRTAAKMLHDGRMDVDITICDEDMELVVVARQLILVLEAQRKFGRAKKVKSTL
jgi:hypothetical protein